MKKALFILSLLLFLDSAFASENSLSSRIEELKRKIEPATTSQTLASRSENAEYIATGQTNITTSNTFCTKCGQPRNGNDKFCGSCGKSFCEQTSEQQIEHSNALEVLKNINDKFIYLCNVSKIDFNTECAKAALEIKKQLESGRINENECKAEYLSSIIAAYSIFDTILPHLINVSNGGTSPLISNNSFEMNLISSMGGGNDFAQILISLGHDIIKKLEGKQSDFSTFKTAINLSQCAKLEEVKKREGGKTKSRNIRFKFNRDIKDFRKIYALVIGSPNKDGDRSNDGIMDIKDDSYCELENVSIYGIGVSFYVVGLK